MGVRILLLGRPAIINERGEHLALRGLQAWAVLARVLLTANPVPRRAIAEELFPEAVDPLGSLRWCLAALRRAIGSADAFCGDPVCSNLPPGTEVDVFSLENGAFDWDRVGELLEDVEPRCAPEFSTWLLVARQRTASQVNARIRSETIRAIAAAETDLAVRLAGLGVRRNPFDEGAHILLVRSLMLAGSERAALQHVEATERAFLDELGVEPSPALRSAARKTVAAPPAGVSPRSVASSRLASGLAAVAAGAVDAGLDCLRAAVASAEKCAEDDLLARALFELGCALVHCVRGHDDEGAILLREAAEAARRASDDDLLSASYRELGYVDALAGRRPAAAAHLAEALLSAGDRPDSLAGVHSILGFNLADWGRIEDAVPQYIRSVEFARRAGNARREAWSLGMLGWAHLRANRPEVARSLLIECLDIVEGSRWLAFRPWPLAALAEADLMLGREPESLLAALGETFALSCQLADPCWEGAAARGLALVHAKRGDPGRALDWAREARARCQRESDTYVGLQAAILATLAEMSSDAEESHAVARALLSLAAAAHLDGYLRGAMELVAAGIEQDQGNR